MPEWMVRLVGAERDLRRLARALRSGEHRITEEEGGFYLRSLRFEALADDGEVIDAADEIIEQANLLAPYVAPGVGAVRTGIQVISVSTDGSRRESRFGIRVAPVMDVSWASDVVLPGSGTAAEAHTDLSVDLADLMAEPHLLHGLRYLRDEPDWTGYYKAFEAIWKAAGGKDRLWQRGWATREEVDSLNDSPQTKRHHVPRRMPRNPMTLAQARTVLVRLARKLVEWVSAGRP
jgi:hypothetical protein